MIEAAVITNNPREVATFLYTHKDLSKKAIGEYFGINNNMARLALREFIEKQNLHGKEIVDALRVFLNSFEMSGESQVIDRILETFSNWFCDVNKNHGFNDSGKVYTSFFFI